MKPGIDRMPDEVPPKSVQSRVVDGLQRTRQVRVLRCAGGERTRSARPPRYALLSKMFDFTGVFITNSERNPERGNQQEPNTVSCVSTEKTA